MNNPGEFNVWRFLRKTSKRSHPIRGPGMNTKAWPLVQAVLAASLGSWGAPLAGQTAPAPLRVEPGLVVVSAVNDRVLQKDYESVLRIEAVGPDGIRSVTDWAIPDGQSPDSVRRQTAQSFQRSQDW